MTPHTSTRSGPDISTVMPCYNEEAVVRYSISRLLNAFHKGGNEGYWAVLEEIPVVCAPEGGIIPAHGQVHAVDVVRLYEAVRLTNSSVLAKGRCRFRLDGFNRRAISLAYKLSFRMLRPSTGSIGIVGSPKLMTRKAAAMGLSVSHFAPNTCWEFLRNLIACCCADRSKQELVLDRATTQVYSAAGAKS
jgi:hypothetical protein